MNGLKMGDIALLDGALEMKSTLESVINSSPIVVFLWCAEENWPVKFVSKNIDMLGYSVEDFTSGKLAYGDIVHPDDISQVRAGISKLTEGVYSDFVQEYRILTKSGEVRWVDERTQLYHNSKGEVTYLQGIIFDITERKNAEKELQEKENRFETLVANIPGATYRCRYDADYTMEYISKEITSISGYPASDLIGSSVRTYASLIHPDDVEMVANAIDRSLTEDRP
uniref:PAS domain-containing protein n=1 Tax=Methanococcoides sp. TaxID=1966350 RepID=UPI00272EAF02